MSRAAQVRPSRIKLRLGSPSTRNVLASNLIQNKARLLNAVHDGDGCLLRREGTGEMGETSGAMAVTQRRSVEVASKCLPF
ncbi:hypothetical protein CHU98_g288 [Xylaria longipes]|nr:hypothetical protein CHU98_g288 [Xylaria longipes]